MSRPPGRERNPSATRRLEGPGAEARLASLRRRFRATTPKPRRMRPSRPPHRQALTLAVCASLLLAGALAVIAAGPGAPARVPADQLSGWPTRITDGDTLRFGARRVRLSGIDAPEMSTPDGEPARRHLAALVATRGPLACQDQGGRTHGRIVARCRTADGADLETLMVEAGWATDFTRHSHGRHLPAQLRAMLDGKGMWAR